MTVPKGIVMSRVQGLASVHHDMTLGALALARAALLAYSRDITGTYRGLLRRAAGRGAGTAPDGARTY